MLIGKPTTWLDRQVDFFPPSWIHSHVHMMSTVAAKPGFVSWFVDLLYTRGGGPDPQPNKKGERLRGLLGSHACVLGLPCKVKKLDSNRPLLTAIETA